MTDHTRTEKIGGDSIYFCGLPSRAGNRYDNVFFDDLSGLSPNQELEFRIELLLGSALIPIPLYRMVSTKLKELKTQL